MEDVRSVLKRQQVWGIKLRPDKCDLFKNEVRYIGKVISAEGYKMDEKEIAAVRALKEKPQRKDVKTTGFLRILQDVCAGFFASCKMPL